MLSAVLQRLGISHLNPMQEAALATASVDRDMLLLAPTGSGKTLAFLLPLIMREHNIRPLILSPSRELTLQTAEVWKRAVSAQTACHPEANCRRRHAAAVTLYGGHELRKERQMLAAGEGSMGMIVGTPGRVADVIRRGVLDPREITLLIIDEFDKMLELGFADVMSEITEALINVRARWLISATSTEEVSSFIASSAVRLDYRGVQLFDVVEQRKYIVNSPQADKLDALRELLPQIPLPTIVFVNHREAVERISSYLSKHKIPHTAFHGGMEQRIREKAMFMFRSLSSNILVSTDLAGRGIDVPEVASVVHYHSPLARDIFEHRNGRATRGVNAAGAVYVIRSEQEKVPEYMSEEALDIFPAQPNAVSNKSLPTPSNTALYISKGKKDKVSKGDIVGWLCKQGGLTNEEIVRIELLDHHAYVAVPSKKAKATMTALRQTTMKGKQVLIEIAR